MLNNVLQMDTITTSNKGYFADLFVMTFNHVKEGGTKLLALFFYLLFLIKSDMLIVLPQRWKCTRFIYPKVACVEAQSSK